MLFIKMSIVELLIIILCCILFCGCGTREFEIIEDKCGTCHKASLVYEKKRSSGDWEILVFGMKARGLKITAEEENELMRVLNNFY